MKLPGVKDVSVNLLKNSMVVSYDESEMNTARIAEAVKNTGYGAIPKEASQNKKQAKQEISTAQAEYKEMKRRLILSALFTIPLFYISMGHMMNWPMPGFLLGMENALVFAFTQFLLLLPVLIVNGRYFRVGFRNLLKGSPNMDSLIAIGSGAAAVYGIYAIYKIGIGMGYGKQKWLSGWRAAFACLGICKRGEMMALDLLVCMDAASAAAVALTGAGFTVRTADTLYAAPLFLSNVPYRKADNQSHNCYYDDVIHKTAPLGNLTSSERTQKPGSD